VLTGSILELVCFSPSGCVGPKVAVERERISDIGRGPSLASSGKIVKSAVQTSSQRPGAEKRKTLTGPCQFLTKSRSRLTIVCRSEDPAEESPVYCTKLDSRPMPV